MSAGAVGAEGTEVPKESAALVLPDVLPVLPLREVVVFPLAVVPLVVGQERSVKLVDDAMRGDRLIALVKQLDPEKQPAMPEDLHRIGAVATIHQFRRSEDGHLRIVVQGMERVRFEEFVGTEPYLRARVARAPEPEDDSVETEAVARSVRELFKELVVMVDELPGLLGEAVLELEDPRQLSYVVAATVPMAPEVRQELLEIDTLRARLRRLVELIQHEIAVRRVSEKVSAETQESLSKAQREFYLREQLKTIRRQLGDEDGETAAADELRRRLDALDLPPEARREADRELGRLERIPAASPEHGIVRTWLEWVADLPWARVTEGPIDVAAARRVLDEDHHDLDRVKDRILEYLAVRKLRRERRGDEAAAEPEREPILCFVGPPGVGKTSLGQSIARALGRRFLRISLGGVHDESEVRGHRRTYIGAMPGRVIQALRRTETSDPVFMLDEMDKLGQGFHGDPAAALLELLDPAQNSTFVDTYLGVPFDLSRVLFVGTANTTATIAGPLRDRMELIELPGYTDRDKLAIARRFLLPKQVRASGLRDDEIEVDDEAILRIVREYTHEAGVRGLDRAIASVCRKAALRAAAAEGTRTHVTAESVPDLLGRPKLQPTMAERTDRPGVATGLAWTPAGGDILFVEAIVAPARAGKLVVTGQLGEVMKESAQAALSFVRSRAAVLGIDPTVFDRSEIHVHVPAGAVPKDGPSAGVTMATALASAVTGRLVRSDVAMTGEITLRGKVLPVGGIKEKALAAHRAGIRTLILPKWNEADLEEIPEELRSELVVLPVESIEEVLDLALAPAHGAPREPGVEPGDVVRPRARPETRA